MSTLVTFLCCVLTVIVRVSLGRVILTSDCNRANYHVNPWRNAFRSYLAGSRYINSDDVTLDSDAAEYIVPRSILNNLFGVSQPGRPPITDNGYVIQPSYSYGSYALDNDDHSLPSSLPEMSDELYEDNRRPFPLPLYYHTPSPLPFYHHMLLSFTPCYHTPSSLPTSYHATKILPAIISSVLQTFVVPGVQSSQREIDVYTGSLGLLNADLFGVLEDINLIESVNNSPGTHIDLLGRGNDDLLSLKPEVDVSLGNTINAQVSSRIDDNPLNLNPALDGGLGNQLNSQASLLNGENNILSNSKHGFLGLGNALIARIDLLKKNKGNHLNLQPRVRVGSDNSADIEADFINSGKSNSLNLSPGINVDLNEPINTQVKPRINGIVDSLNARVNLFNKGHALSLNTGVDVDNPINANINE